MRVYLYRAEDLRGYITRFLQKFGVPLDDAEIVADVLVTADLRGVNSHGIIRLHTYYGNRLRQELIDPTSPVTTIKETATTLVLNGGNGLGQVVAHRAMESCIEKAEHSGIAMVTVRNSNHFGIAGYYAMMALSHNMIGISLTNSQPFVPPTYGRTAILGTNPIAVAVPTDQERPYVLDMATSIVPAGRITVYEKAHEEIPLGWGMDSSGELTTDPAAVLNGGAVLPLGGTDEMRGYKGYGLALLVDILSGVLSGAAFGPNVGHISVRGPANIGHFFAALKIEAFHPLQDFARAMDRFIQQIRNAPRLPGDKRIYIHGEKEFEQAERYTKEGIPLMEELVNALKQAGKKAGVEFDISPVVN